MRLIFFYLQHRNAGYYFKFLRTEGYFWLLKRMLETGIVDEVLAVIDSSQQMPPVQYMSGFTELGEANHGTIVPAPVQYMSGFTGISVQGVENIPGGIQKDDVICVRGGWKSWFPFLEKLKAKKHKLFFYAANTGRERWPHWDVIFDDLNGKDFMDAAGRMHIDFRKPTNPMIFFPMQIERKYDLCIGASHIHDKKGQWRGIKAVMGYQNIFGKKLKCILPGSFRRGSRTNHIMDDIREHDLDVELPGMLSRYDMVKIYNQSKLFLHLGSGGQGDRGVLEAMRCGCPVMIGYPRYHAPFTYETDLSYVAADPDHYSTLAYEISEQLELSTEEKRIQVFEYHEAQCGVETVVLPRIRQLWEEMFDEKI